MSCYRVRTWTWSVVAKKYSVTSTEHNTGNTLTSRGHGTTATRSSMRDQVSHMYACARASTCGFVGIKSAPLELIASTTFAEDYREICRPKSSPWKPSFLSLSWWLSACPFRPHPQRSTRAWTRLPMWRTSGLIAVSDYKLEGLAGLLRDWTADGYVASWFAWVTQLLI